MDRIKKANLKNPVHIHQNHRFNKPLQIYAIKRITLDAKNKAMTKKLMREVKLLSRLNHENVVRYVCYDGGSFCEFQYVQILGKKSRPHI